MINWLLFNHIPFGTILEIQERHHYQKDWRLIHHSLNWTWIWVYYWIWSIDWLLLNNNYNRAIFVHQEQHHYQKYWRSIHPSLNWTWDWVYFWIWLIDYYSITFHLEQYWFIRSNIIIRRIEGQFISHSIEPENECIIESD